MTRDLSTKDYSSLYTPTLIAHQMVEMADAPTDESLCWLEPSAGDGALIVPISKRIMQAGGSLDYFELQGPLKRQFVPMNNSARFQGAIFRGYDFLPAHCPQYDRIIANPPFEEDVWLAHVMKMYSLLKVGGIMVCIAPVNLIANSDEQFQKFVDGWFTLMGAQYFPIENWHKNANGTITKIWIIKIVKHYASKTI